MKRIKIRQDIEGIIIDAYKTMRKDKWHKITVASVASYRIVRKIQNNYRRRRS